MSTNEKTKCAVNVTMEQEETEGAGAPVAVATVGAPNTTTPATGRAFTNISSALFVSTASDEVLVQNILDPIQRATLENAEEAVFNYKETLLTKRNENVGDDDDNRKGAPRTLPQESTGSPNADETSCSDAPAAPTASGDRTTAGASTPAAAGAIIPAARDRLLPRKKMEEQSELPTSLPSHVSFEGINEASSSSLSKPMSLPDELLRQQQDEERQQEQSSEREDTFDSAVLLQSVNASLDAGQEENHQVQPGAFAVYPAGVSGSERMEDDVEGGPFFRRWREESGESSSNQQPNNNVLVEANLVIDEERLLVQAEPIVADNSQRIIFQLKVMLLVLIVSVLLAALIVGLLLGLPRTVPSTSTNTSNTTSTSNTTNTSNTSITTKEWEVAFRTSLPDYTRAAIRDGVSRNQSKPSLKSTPQYEAYQWVTETDQLHLPLPEDKRILRMTQRFVLATFYYATDGENWKLRSNWLGPTDDECRWLGCSCDVDMVQSIILDSNGLFNAMPQELSLLSTSLKTLQLSDNAFLGGSIPVEFGLLSNLANLLLPRNALSGTIPTQLGDLVNLVEIDLGGNGELNGPIPSELGKLSSLVRLDLQNTALTGTIPVELCNLIEANEANATIPSNVDNCDTD